MALVFTDSADYPNAADLCADFVYARLMRSRDDCATGYPPPALAQWARRIDGWRHGHDHPDLPHASPVAAAAAPREVFVYFISAAKERNPAAAMALIERLSPH